MGGSFNPFHLGHLNSLMTVKKTFDLDQIILIPTYQTPLKSQKEKNDIHRLKMLKKTFENTPFIHVDDQEINRKTISYSYKTVNKLAKDHKGSELFLLVGMDQFHIFDQWRQFSKILQKINLIVTSRYGMPFPKTLSECPQGLKPLLKRKYRNKIFLKKSPHQIHFCSLKDKDISSTAIKEKIKMEESVERLLPSSVFSYIKKWNLYKKKSVKTDKKLVQFCKQELENKQAFKVKIFDLKNHSVPFSFGLIASGMNTRQTKALAKHLKKMLKQKFNLIPLNEEGQKESRWIVLDYGDVVIHIFYDYTRGRYLLDQRWQTIGG